MDNMCEMLPWVNEKGETIGCISRREAHGGSFKLHPVVHLHLFNGKGELFLQKRPEWKDVQPGKWDTSVGGHVDLGESVEIALRREAREELGITDFVPELLLHYVFESDRERELVFSYRATYNEIITPTEELSDGRFWKLDEIRKSLGTGLFTPNFEKEFQKLQF